MRVTPATRVFATTTMALAASFTATVLVLAWAFWDSGVRLESLDAICAKLPHTEGSPSGEWSWFPPGLRCFADGGAAASRREILAPSWWDSLIPLTLLGIALVWLLMMIISTMRATARVHSQARAFACGVLLLTASALIVCSAPVALDMTGALAVIWVPAALLVALPLLITTGLLLRPGSAQKRGSG